MAIAEIKEQIKLLVKNSLSEFIKSNEDDSIYGLLCRTPPEGNYVGCIIMSEKQLSKNVEYYLKWYPENGYEFLSDRPSEVLTKSLRWNTGEDWFSFSSECLSSLILDTMQQGSIELFDRKTEKLCIESLLELDKDGYFVFNNHRIVLGLTYTAETSEEFMSWIEQLNPPEIVSQVEFENNEMYKMVDFFCRLDK
jgi:hypothetical protein